MDSICSSCMYGLRHDHRRALGAVCPHQDGPCCGDVLREEVGMLVAAFELARGRGPRDARQVLRDPIRDSWTDDVG